MRPGTKGWLLERPPSTAIVSSSARVFDRLHRFGETRSVEVDADHRRTLLGE
jgi:hypothetical protein